MVAGSVPGEDNKTTKFGIAKGHAYTLLNASEFNINGSKVKLIQLRNPWGVHQYKGDRGEYYGPWCDNDPKWNYVSQDQKKKYGLSKKRK